MDRDSQTMHREKQKETLKVSSILSPCWNFDWQGKVRGVSSKPREVQMSQMRLLDASAKSRVEEPEDIFLAPEGRGCERIVKLWILIIVELKAKCLNPFLYVLIWKCGCC